MIEHWVHIISSTALTYEPHVPLDLWTYPAGVMALVARWMEKLAGGPQTGTSDSPPPLAKVMGVGRQ